MAKFDYDLQGGRGRDVLDLRPWKIPGVPLLGRHGFSNVYPPLPPHRHPDMEICYLARGEQIFRVAGKSHHLRGGDVYVTFPGEVHDTGRHPLGRGLLYWLIVQLPEPSRPRPRLLSTAGSEAVEFGARLAAMPRRKFAGQPDLHRSLKRVFELTERTALPLRRLHIEQELTRFLLAVLECSERAELDRINPKFRNLTQEIRARPETDWSMARMAGHTGFSVSHFKNRFRRELGVSPWEYVLRARIETSRKRLLRSATSITDLALELGFSSSQHFATTFRKFVGMSPSEFRRRGGT